jgi:uncharacterized GH25 family protein
MAFKPIKLFTGLILFLAVIPTLSTAHEFWIEPQKPIAGMSEKISAHVRVGQDFDGEAQYFIPDNIDIATITDSNGSTDLVRIIGDFPIFEFQARNTGLQILAYTTTPGELTYKEPGKFRTFLISKGLQRVIAEHEERGLPDIGFKEFFVRYAKALLVRGENHGKDKNLGLKFELVALDNPYKIKLKDGTGTVRVQLFWNGKPLGDAQISIFEKSADSVIKNHVKTAGNGLVSIHVKSGKTYLLNAVEITAEKPLTGAVWKSHWASLTFTIN